MRGPTQLRAALHRRRDGRRSDRRRPRGSKRPGLTQTLDYPRRKRRHDGRGRSRDPRLPRADRRDRRGRHRPQHLAEADPARTDRRPRHLRRQPAPHPRRRGARTSFFVRIDMEDSRYTQVTLDIFETLWQQGYRNVGIVLQSYLPRSDGGRAADERARRAGAAGQGRVPASRASVAYQRRRRSTRRSSRSCSCCSTEGDLPRHRDPRSGDDRRDRGVRRQHARSAPIATSSRCCTASGATCRRAGARGLPGARLHPVRPRVVPLLHAPAGRAAGQCRLRRPQPASRALTAAVSPFAHGTVSAGRRAIALVPALPLPRRVALTASAP